MLPTQKYNSYETTFDITDKNGDILGDVTFRCDVRRFADASNSQSKTSFLVKCTQAIRIFAQTAHTSQYQWQNYPVYVTSGIDVLNVQYKNIDYFPKTLNSAVSVARNTSTSSGVASEEQHSSGSSQSQTNSHGGSISLGFMGDIISGGVSANFEQSKSASKNRSHEDGHSNSHDDEVGGSASFSIKDWAAYGCRYKGTLGGGGWERVVFTWGQEFPWNVIRYKPGGVSLGKALPAILPEYVKERMGDEKLKLAYPPSDLSMFGLDLHSSATWSVNPDLSSVSGSKVDIECVLFELIFGSHGYDPSNNLDFEATIYSEKLKNQVNKISIDIVELSLLPLSATPIGHAGVNLKHGHYQAVPKSSREFLMLSDTNQIKVTGSGFSKACITNFPKKTASLNIHFKILEDQESVTLFFKHWLIGSGEVELIFTINKTGKTFKRLVNFERSEGLEKNVTSITLRDREFMSDEFCDYLKTGLNEISVVLSPNGKSSKGIQYELSAITIA